MNPYLSLLLSAVFAAVAFAAVFIRPKPAPHEAAAPGLRGALAAAMPQLRDLVIVLGALGIIVGILLGQFRNFRYATYAAVWIGAVVLATVLTAVVMGLARRAGIYDTPDARKVHLRAVPRVGGAAIVVATLAMIVAVLFLDNRIGRAFRDMWVQIVAVLAASVLVFLLGLVDDLRGLGARAKFAVQVVAAVMVCAFGVRIDTVTVDGVFSVDLGIAAWPLTVFWIVGITNALNLIDGLDGLAASISIIACAVLAVFAGLTHQLVMAVVMIALVGSLVGFLILNFNPARVFMGDGGSYFLGFVIASSSVLCTSALCGPRPVNALGVDPFSGLAIPLLALGVPVLDTLFCMLRRAIRRRGIMSADRGHIHHRLLDMGFSPMQATLIICAVTLMSSGLGLILMFTRGLAAVLVFLTVGLLLVLVFRLVGAVRLFETIDGLRKNMALAREIKTQTRQFEATELLIQHAKVFDEWWKTLCQSAERMSLCRLEMTVTNRDGSTRTLSWQGSGPALPAEQVLHVVVPIPQRRAGSPLAAEIDVPIEQSIEDAARRAMLFGRLIDEYGITALGGALPEQAGEDRSQAVPAAEVDPSP
jgi:UDP-GlcNAc:undecaprenyl-phosphate GlcNAc-1-phosphate transferase